ncbi:MAG: transcription antitermination factor NusB [Patescibacteria group bacterium]
MASRHLSRSHVLQTLFECDSLGAFNLEGASVILKRNLKDFAEGDSDVPFAEFLLKGVIAKQKEIDDVIVASAPAWPLDKIAPIDRNILRIGLFELLFGDKTAVPPKVALNEAIELAKSYGSDSSGKFINGVLGAVYRSIGSPGKEDAPKDSTPLPHEHLGGVVLVAVTEGKAEVALVLDAFDHWTLPKTKCKENELSDSAARRAALQELGAIVEIKGPVGEHEYIAHGPEVGRIVRTVGYFLALTPEAISLSVGEGAGVTDARWFSEETLGGMKVYEDIVPIIEAGIAEAKRVWQ